jgi:hypothetical protein
VVLSGERFGAAGRLAASLLTLPAAVGIGVGSLGTLLSVLGSALPAGAAGPVPTALLVAGRVGIALGCALAVLGIALGARGGTDRDRLARYYRTVAGAGAVPLALTLLLGGGRVLSAVASGDPGAGGLVAGVAGWLLAPEPALHVASTLLLAAAAAASLRAAVGALPVAELLADRGAGRRRHPGVERLRRGLAAVAVVALAASLPGFLLDSQFRTVEGLALAVGPAVASAVGAVGTPPVRAPLVAVALAAAPAAAAAALGRRLLGSPSAAAVGGAPLAGGAVLAGLGLAFGGPVFDLLVGAVAGWLPAAVAPGFRAAADGVAGFFSRGVVVVGLYSLFVLLTAAAVLGVRVALWVGYLPERTGGFALAAAGLFGATALAGAVGAPALPVFAGLAASLLVRDAGAVAAGLGREVGRAAPSGDAELVRLGGTVAVGVVAVGVAAAIRLLLARIPPGDGTAAAAGLLAALVGIVALVAALR